MIGSQFAIQASDIPKSVIDAALSEADLIFNSDYAGTSTLTGRTRTLHDVRKDTLLGKIGEYIIKTNFGYVEDDAKWHDLISPTGERTEIKTWRKQYITEANTNKVMQQLRNRKKSTRQWFFSTKAIVISCDEQTNVFTIENVYDI